MSTYLISSEMFSNFEDALNLSSIVEKHRISKVVRFKGKLFVPTMAMGTGTGIGWKIIKAREIVPINCYNLNVKPLPYIDHFFQVDLKNRERSYFGMMVLYQSKVYVFTDIEIELKPTTEAIQIALFN